MKKKKVDQACPLENILIKKLTRKIIIIHENEIMRELSTKIELAEIRLSWVINAKSSISILDTNDLIAIQQREGRAVSGPGVRNTPPAEPEFTIILFYLCHENAPIKRETKKKKMHLWIRRR